MEAHEELLNIYDETGAVIGTAPRGEAKARGAVIGAVNLLLVNRDGHVLLQRRHENKENGGRWDKSVGGHVAAGEDWDGTVVREASEELLDESLSPRVRLAADAGEFERLLAEADLSASAVLRRASLQKNLRDVRALGSGRLRTVVYHVGVYLGRTDIPAAAFRPQADEIAGLRYFAPAEVDELLLSGALAPNMAFLWLTHALPLLRLARLHRG
jgi:isopentenyldiphosphate isomerase